MAQQPYMKSVGNKSGKPGEDHLGLGRWSYILHHPCKKGRYVTLILAYSSRHSLGEKPPSNNKPGYYLLFFQSIKFQASQTIKETVYTGHPSMDILPDLRET